MIRLIVYVESEIDMPVFIGWFAVGLYFDSYRVLPPVKREIVPVIVCVQFPMNRKQFPALVFKIDFCFHTTMVKGLTSSHQAKWGRKGGK